ncbi:MAG: ATP-binding protein [Planctomycetota bacterium]|nr:ATP-binding protein [Planctomycetota bacterium]
MKIAIASGKGGTGKTTVATNLAYVASRNGQSVAYLDCDVEEPNGHIFLKPQIAESKPIGNLIPEVNEDMCIQCGKCGEICRYSAIVCVGDKVLVYPELCHACGGCALVCPVDAITETPRELGKLETGQAGPIRFVQGLLNIGEAMSPPLIKEVKAAAPEVDLVIADAPPGTSCPVIESVKDSDFVLLVTEPTPFGLNDLKLAVEMVRVLKIPFGVVVNRANVGDRQTQSYCNTNRIEILAEIPDDRKIAEAYSRGEMICEVMSDYASLLAGLLKRIIEKVQTSSPQTQENTDAYF